MINEWECKIYDDPITLHIKLYVFRINQVGKIEYAHIKENGNIWLTQQEKQFEEIKPFIELNRMMAKELFKGLAQALDNSGIKTDSTAKIEGTLQATKYHLEDLRKILKLNNSNIIKERNNHA